MCGFFFKHLIQVDGNWILCKHLGSATDMRLCHYYRKHIAMSVTMGHIYLSVAIL